PPTPAPYPLSLHDALPILTRLKERATARFVCLIHDLIPIEFPEYAKPGQAEHHFRRIETAARLADAVIVNSAVTRDSLMPHLDRSEEHTSELQSRSDLVCR